MRKTWKTWVAVAALLGAGCGLQAQSGLPTHDAMYQLDAQTGLPSFVRYTQADMPAADQLLATIYQSLKLDGITDRLVETKRTSDALGFSHLTLQHVHDGHAVFGSVLKAHVRAGKLECWNGKLLPVAAHAQAGLSESEALSAALRSWGAALYKWQVPGEDAVLQQWTGNANATFFPKGELVYVTNRGTQSAEAMRLAWRFDIYAHQPAAHAEVFVDAQTGETIYRNELMHSTDVPATATTRYSGQRSIVTDSTGPGAYRMREGVHGQGVETYNIHNTTNYFGATDFTDADNVWDNFSPAIDQVAADAHWGAEVTYEYYLAKHGRDSYDDNGGKLMSYVHYDNNLFNASWNGFVMNYGDGTNNLTPLTTLDVCGHELTHGVTQYAAGLVYQDESGALNESFSDIFGNTIERYARPNQNSWAIAEDIGAFRSMSNPNQYQNPDTYFGTYWATGAGDNGGVHTNSGVQNFWYYLLAEGGTGTNDNGDLYNITGLGLDTAAMIAYRNLNTYITPNSDYAAARYGAIQAAIDLFGECSFEMIETWNAWAAVGLGTPFTTNLAASFSTQDTNLCEFPFVVDFQNTSSGGIHFLWQFGDGTTSSAENPSHTYAFTGDYSVTLIAYGCNGTSDTLSFPNLVHIDVNQVCPISMPAGSGTNSSNACEGILYDSGGGDDYLPNTNGVISIAPNNGSQVQLTFTAFNYAAGDRVTVYDGTTIADPQIGIYSGTTIPPVITSTSGALTVKESTNGGNNRSGFVAHWSCFVGVADALLADLFVSPNPSHGLVRLQWDLGMGDAYEVRILDLQGRLLRDVAGQHAGSLDLGLDLHALAAGSYVLQVQSGAHVATRKLLIE